MYRHVMAERLKPKPGGASSREDKTATLPPAETDVKKTAGRQRATGSYDPRQSSDKPASEHRSYSGTDGRRLQMSKSRVNAVEDGGGRYTQPVEVIPESKPIAVNPSRSKTDRLPDTTATSVSNNTQRSRVYGLVQGRSSRPDRVKRVSSRPGNELQVTVSPPLSPPVDDTTVKHKPPPSRFSPLPSQALCNGVTGTKGSTKMSTKGTTGASSNKPTPLPLSPSTHSGGYQSLHSPSSTSSGNLSSGGDLLSGGLSSGEHMDGKARVVAGTGQPSFGINPQDYTPTGEHRQPSSFSYDLRQSSDKPTIEHRSYFGTDGQKLQMSKSRVNAVEDGGGRYTQPVEVIPESKPIAVNPSRSKTDRLPDTTATSVSNNTQRSGVYGLVQGRSSRPDRVKRVSSRPGNELQVTVSPSLSPPVDDTTVKHKPPPSRFSPLPSQAFCNGVTGTKGSTKMSTKGTTGASSNKPAPLPLSPSAHSGGYHSLHSPSSTSSGNLSSGGDLLSGGLSSGEHMDGKARVVAGTGQPSFGINPQDYTPTGEHRQPSSLAEDGAAGTISTQATDRRSESNEHEGICCDIMLLATNSLGMSDVGRPVFNTSLSDDTALRHTRSQYQALERMVQELESKNAALQGQLNEQDRDSLEEGHNYRQEFDRLVSEVSRLSPFEEQVAHLKEEIKHMEKRYEHAKGIEARLVQQVSLVSLRESEIETLKKCLDSEGDEQKSDSRKEKELYTEISRLKEQVEVKNCEIARVKACLKKQKSRSTDDDATVTSSMVTESVRTEYEEKLKRKDIVIDRLKKKVAEQAEAAQLEVPPSLNDPAAVDTEKLMEANMEQASCVKSVQTNRQSTSAMPDNLTDQQGGVFSQESLRKAVKERDQKIKMLSDQLQSFVHTASNVEKISRHAKEQSGEIARLRSQLQDTETEHKDEASDRRPTDLQNQQLFQQKEESQMEQSAKQAIQEAQRWRDNAHEMESKMKHLNQQLHEFREWQRLLVEEAKEGVNVTGDDPAAQAPKTVNYENYRELKKKFIFLTENVVKCEARNTEMVEKLKERDEQMKELKGGTMSLPMTCDSLAYGRDGELSDEINIEAALSEVERLKKALVDRDNHITSLQTQISSAGLTTSERSKMEMHGKEQSKTVMEWRKKFEQAEEEIQSLRMKEADLVQEVRELNSNLDKLKRDILSKEDDLDAWKCELTANKAKEATLEKALAHKSAEIAALKTEKESMHRNLDALKQELERTKFEKSAQQFSSIQSKQDVIQVKLAQSIQTVRRLTLERQKLEEQNRFMAEAHGYANSKLDEAEKKNESLREEVSEHKKKIADMTVKVNELVTQKSASEEKNHVMANTLKSLEHTKFSLEQKDIVHKEWIQILQQDLQCAKQKADEYTVLAKKYQMETCDQHKQIQELKETAKAMERERELEMEIKVHSERAMEAEVESRESRAHWIIRRDEIELTSVELGRGGWGEVIVANFRGTQVAAKCFYRELNSEYYQDMFSREINMAARLRHPNLVQFIGAFIEGKPIILTELMTTSLRDELEQGRILQSQVTPINLDVAKALNYLHLMKPHPIVHRDINSANVLLDPVPHNRWKAKVADYGSVNLQHKLQTVNPGGPVYIAPEACVPALQSPKMDIYSFGVLLVEILSGKLPDVSCRQHLIKSIKDAKYVSLIKQCLSEKQDSRPSAQTVITMLNKI